MQCAVTEVLRDDDAGIARAAARLRDGELVAFATETVYGLGADATDGRAVAEIFAAKQRPRFNPLICHYPDSGSVFADVAANDAALRLAAEFWPGPLTLVLPRRDTCCVSLLASAGLDTLAVRVPGHAAARALLRQVGRPVAAPSANRSGKVSPTTAQHVMAELAGRIAAVLDCGACTIGIELTVVDLSGEVPALLRPGGATTEAIEAMLGELRPPPGGALRSPGMLSSHYAPGLPLRLNARGVDANEVLLAFGPPLPGAAATFNLSEVEDLAQAAGRLFAGLRSLDGSRAERIAVMPIPDIGLGRAINDRLRRAAAPRD